MELIQGKLLVEQFKLFKKLKNFCLNTSKKITGGNKKHKYSYHFSFLILDLIHIIFFAERKSLMIGGHLSAKRLPKMVDMTWPKMNFFLEQGLHGEILLDVLEGWHGILWCYETVGKMSNHIPTPLPSFNSGTLILNRIMFQKSHKGRGHVWRNLCSHQGILK